MKLIASLVSVSVALLAAHVNAFGGMTTSDDDFMGGIFNQEKFQKLVDGYAKESETRGVTAAVVYGDRVVTASSGMASDGTQTCGDVGEVVPMTPETPMLFGSITKVFTASYILKLAEEGKLKLSDPICNYLSSKVCNHLENAKDVDIETLISHRTGIWPYFEQFETEDPTDSFGLMEDAMKEYSPEDLIMFTESKSKFAPKNNSHYSNTNFILAGMIISNATGLTTNAGIADLMQMVPADLKDEFSFPYYTDEWTGAHGYVNQKDSPKVFPEGCYDVFHKISLSLAGTAGNVDTTSKAMAIFMQRLATGEVISKESLDNMMTFRGNLSTDGFGPWTSLGWPYGLGMMNLAPVMGIGFPNATELDKYGGRVYGHQGNFPGYQAWSGFFYPQNQEKYPGVVSFAIGFNAQNLENSQATQFLRDIGKELVE